MPQLTQNQLNAAGPIVDLVATRIGKGREVQSETAIACASRLAGSLLLRSFNFNIGDMEPGVVVLSDNANIKGSELISIAGTIVRRFGLNIDPTSATKKGRGQEPELSFLEALNLLQADAIQISNQFNLSLEETGQAAAVATGYIVKECARSIDVEVGFNAAVYGFIEGSKTVPPKLNVNDEKRAKKSWYKFW